MSTENIQYFITRLNNIMNSVKEKGATPAIESDLDGCIDGLLDVLEEIKNESKKNSKERVKNTVLTQWREIKEEGYLLEMIAENKGDDFIKIEAMLVKMRNKLNAMIVNLQIAREQWKVE